MDSGSVIQKARSSDFLVDVQKGNVAGHSLVHKFGRNDAVANGVWEHVSLGSAATFFLAAPVTVRVKAGDAADDTAGAGAREITVQGIDTNLNEITESIVTAGTSASSATTASFWRIHRAWVSAAGTLAAANTAAVVIENSAGVVDIITIATQEGQTFYAGWTVPIGKTAYFLSAHIMTDATKAADFRFRTRSAFNDTSVPLASKRTMLYFDGVLGHMTFKPRSPGSPIPALTDVWWEAEGGGATSEVSVDFELLVVDD